MTPNQAKAILARRGALIPDVLAGSFPQQRAFIEDPARFKAVFCTRRAAKSFTDGLALIHSALRYPKSNGLFIGLTRQSAYDIVWKDVFHRLNDQYRLGIRFNESRLTLTFPNGSVIRVTGADSDADEMKKLLGKKYKMVCIDEASMFTVSVQSLVNLLEPAMADERGTIILSGTASNFTRGLFYEISTGKAQGWAVHTWSAHDNPYVARQWKEQLDLIAKDRPLYQETPQFKQWFLNQWIVDEEKLVYRFQESRNLYKELPRAVGDWTTVLSIDLGWDDDNAFLISQYHDNIPELYVPYSWSAPKMTFDQVGDKAMELVRKWGPSKIIIDGANKQGVESMRQRTHLPFEAADKADKATFIEMLNADLIQGKIKIHESLGGLRNELMGLVWLTDKEDKIKLPREEHPNLPNHKCDSLLYGWRCGFHYTSQPVETKIILGSKEWYERHAEDIWDMEREQIEKSVSGEGGEWPSEGSFGSLG